MFNTIFQLKFTSKRLAKLSKKAESESIKKKKQVAAYIKKGDLEIARIHADDAIRKKNESVNLLNLSAKVDGMRSRLEAVSAQKQVAKQLARVTKSMESSLGSMDIMNIAMTLDQFEQKMEDIGVMEAGVSDVLERNSEVMTDQNEVNELIMQVADEYNLALQELMPDIVNAEPTRVSAPDNTQTVTNRGQLAQ
eukprot:TRINITY_DN5036_c0_g1_i2.p1 TRINITY_DN5036_c0_g1~~TRINITY_DN5036_c0_g1_i2.p1  ORF type:complete len:194 (+),score=49.66 TRINITY_DN5036_c0_g1_i2:146-727(+)